jgi:sugar O-acyltransferase (sialic acid O-acetyltransferase NeuD family)
MIPVAGVGAGGHAKVIIDILRQGNRYEVVALTDNNPKLWGSSYCDVPIIGDDHMLTSLRPKVEHAFLGIGSVRSSALRSHLYQMVRELGLEFLNAIHPTAVISPTAKLGCGVAVMAGAIVNPGATIGDNVIVNTGAIIDHDCTIADHSHIAPGACLSGTVRVGKNCHVGVGACVLQGIVIGDGATVGAGAVVVRDVAAGATVVGVPAKPLSRSADEMNV